MMKGRLAERVEFLEHQTVPAGRVRLCWHGNEPVDLKPGDTLYRLSWIDEDQKNDGA